MKKKILWIEDGAFFELRNLVGPVVASGKYDLDIALDVSDGLRKIMQNVYEAIIFDIRLPPGNEIEWVKLYMLYGNSKIEARLGKHLLYTLLQREEANIKLEKEIPAWLNHKKFGILTVESRRELEEDLKNLGISIYIQKQSSTPISALLDIIEKILSQ